MRTAEQEPAARIGYVVKVYPRFSETFVVTEILARERAGDRIAIFAMRPTTDARFHPELAQVQAPVHHLPKPGKLTEAWGLIAAAQREIPDFAARYAQILPVLARMEATDAAQAIDLALRARAERITHLHAHFASLAARVAMIAAHLVDIPYSVTTHAKDIFHQDVDPLMLGEVLSRAEYVVAISEFNRRHLHAAFPQTSVHTRLVRNGLDLARFGYRDPSPVTGRLEVVAVGRLVEKKGFAHLVEAAAQLRAAAVPFRVRIAGDGELYADLQAAIVSLGLAEQVQLLGPRSQAEIRSLLGEADVFVAPCVVGADGNADGLPTVLLEAMATGVPCVATAVTGIPEAIRPQRGTEPATGILLELPADPAGEPGGADRLAAELAAALRTVAAADFARVGMARAARALIERDYDTATQSRLLSDLHRDSRRAGADGCPSSDSDTSIEGAA